MNKEFEQWLERKRYMHWRLTPDGHTWIIHKKGIWKWKQIIFYESKIYKLASTTNIRLYRDI